MLKLMRVISHGKLAALGAVVLVATIVLLLQSGLAVALTTTNSSGDVDAADIGTDNSKEFTNKGNQYKAKYPKSWHVYEIPNMSYMRFETIDVSARRSLTAQEKQDYFKIEVVVLSRNGLSLAKWVERQNTTSYPLPTVHEQRDITVAGYPAVYQIEQFYELVKPVIFIAKDEHIYVINPSSDDVRYKNDINQFLNDFTFTQ